MSVEMLQAPGKVGFQEQHPLSKQEPSPSYLNHFIQELYDQSTRLLSKWMLFHTIHTGQSNLDGPRSFYLTHAQVLVPSHDFDIEVRRMAKKSQKVPTKSEFFRRKALELFNRDVEVANRYKSGQVRIKGKGVGLQDLINELEDEINDTDKTIVEKQGKLFDIQVQKILNNV